MSSYNISKFMKEDGFSNIPENRDIKYSSKQLKMGIAVEMEHTTNKKVAKKIAKDHLAEFPDYYTRLARMEKDAKLYWKDRK